MSRILVHAAGAAGELAPFLALGRALSGRGHRVLLAVDDAEAPRARQAGLDAVPLGDAPDRDAKLIVQARALAAACREADLLVATSSRVQGLLAARSTGIPWITVALHPAHLPQPESDAEREVRVDSSQDAYRRLRGGVAGALRDLGSPGTLPPWSLAWHWAPRVLVACSPRFFPVSLDALQPDHGVDQTGFWIHRDREAGWAPEEDLEEFCRQAPIVLWFDGPHLPGLEQTLRLSVEAAAILGRKLAIGRWPSRLAARDLPPGTGPDAVRVLDSVPGEWIFARAGCAIQAGEPGDIAEALMQGCPLLIEPFRHEQHRNALRVTGLGAGAAMHPLRMTAGSLAHALDTAVLTPECRRRAGEIGAVLRSEDGTGQACDLIEAFIRSSGNVAVGPLPAGGAIPGIVHQARLPAPCAAPLERWRASWLEHNPGWEHRFWSEERCRELIEGHYRWFLPVFERGADASARVALARPLILHRHGGLFAEPHLECLRPLEPLVAGRDILLAIEPDPNLEPDGTGGAKHVSPSLLASTPAHPFWDHLARSLAGASAPAAGGLRSSHIGRALESFPQRDRIRLESPGTVLPRSHADSWEALPEAERELIGASAFTMNHWLGSWWRGAVELPVERLRPAIAVIERGARSARRHPAAGELAASRTPGAEPPLVSCLMLTRDRPDLARRAVRCFLAQTHAPRELVIVDSGEGRELEEWVAGLAAQGVRHFKFPAGGTSLGELRNRSVALAGGEYVAQWDDDDLSDPLRLQVQLAALLALGADACLLERQLVWWPGERRLAVSCRRPWENSLLAARAALPRFLPLDRGEDTPVVAELTGRGRVALLDAPWLFTYVRHGANTWSSPHWDEHWLVATERFAGEGYGLALARLAGRLPVCGVPAGAGLPSHARAEAT